MSTNITQQRDIIVETLGAISNNNFDKDWKIVL